MAELAIGSVAFFFQVFAGCIQGYELIADACRLEDDAQALLVKFKLEEHRLLNWARLVQMDYRDDKLVLNHLSKGIIINIMEQQQKLLFSFGRLDKKYERLSRPLLVEEAQEFVLQNSDRLLENGEGSTNSVNGSSEGRKKTVQFPPTEDLVKMSLNFMQSFRNVPRRLKWAAFDHKKMEALIAKLSDFNDKMHEALDKAQMDLLIDMQTRTNDQIVLLNRTMTHMVQIYQSERLNSRHQDTITELEDSEYDGLTGSFRSVASIAAPQPLAALVQQSFIHRAIEGPQDSNQAFANEIGLPNLAHDASPDALSFEDIRIKEGSKLPSEDEESVRTEAFYKNSPVWIEWKVPDPSSPMQQDIDPNIRNRVKKLAALLNKNNRTVTFRAPFCRGYFVDEEECRFGLVFEKPASVSADTEPVSLYSLISAKNPDGSEAEIPSLTDRITLMRHVSGTVERLHAVDWLHKGLRSGNIILFPKPDGEIDFANPFISGFDYSRPATSDEMTERPSNNAASDIYRHPTVQSRGNKEDREGRESYKKSFDLYSLGIVLLEIAHWKTIDQILAIKLESARPKDTWPVRERLLEKDPKHLKYVKSHLGKTVESVIRSCLVGPTAFGLSEDCDEKRELVAAELQRAFVERVVNKLALMKGF